MLETGKGIFPHKSQSTDDQELFDGVSRRIVITERKYDWDPWEDERPINSTEWLWYLRAGSV